MYSPPDPVAFRAKVYEIVEQVPLGRVTTYGFIARLIPPPPNVDPEQYARLSPRWVGTAMADCPDDLPWQRVINAQGGISRREISGGHIVQRKLLEAEGIPFDERDRIDLKTYGWSGPPADWCREHGLIPPEAPAGSQLSLL